MAAPQITFMNFQSDDDENELNLGDDETSMPFSKKTRGKSRCYYLDKTFDSQELAEAEIMKETFWSKNNRCPSKIGDKQFYRCNLAPYRGAQCDASLYLLFHADSNQFSIYRTQCAHSHNERKLSVPLETRVEIDKLYDRGIKTPRLIIDQLGKIPDIKVPLLKDLYNYLASLKLKKRATVKTNLKELASGCQEHEKSSHRRHSNEDENEGEEVLTPQSSRDSFQADQSPASFELESEHSSIKRIAPTTSVAQMLPSKRLRK